MEKKQLTFKEKINLKYFFYDQKSDSTFYFVHGLGDSISSFSRLIEPILKTKANIILYDLPGCGDNRDCEVTFEENLEILNKLTLLHGSLYKYFIGHSLGGLIVLLTIIKYNIKYLKIITIEPSITLPDLKIFRMIREKPLGLGFEEFVKNINPNNEYSYYQVYKKNLLNTNLNNFKSFVKTINENFHNYQCRIFDSQVKFIYFYGSNSTEPSERAILKKYQNIDVKCLNGANHWGHIDAENEFIAFLSENIINSQM